MKAERQLRPPLAQENQTARDSHRETVKRIHRSPAQTAAQTAAAESSEAEETIDETSAETDENRSRREYLGYH